MVVPPVTVVSTPSDVAVRSVTSESIVRIPRRLNELTSVRACTVTLAPSVVVEACEAIEPAVATAGAAMNGMVASALDPPPLAATRAPSPGAGVDSAVGAPTPDDALTRYG